MAYTEERQAFPNPGIAEDMGRIKRFDGPPAKFWPAFLKWLTRVTAADPDPGDVLTFNQEAGPASATIDPVTGLLDSGGRPRHLQDNGTGERR
jgi:hypothetical protein